MTKYLAWVFPEHGKERSSLLSGLGLLAFVVGVAVDKRYCEIPMTAIYIPLMIMTGFLAKYYATIYLVSFGADYLSYRLSAPEFWSAEQFLFRGFSLFSVAMIVRMLIQRWLEERSTVTNLTSTLATTIDMRDKYTSSHSHNVARYARRIADAMGLPKNVVVDVYLGGLLHDIGKIGIPESILNKPGALTAEEYQAIKRHPEIGYNILKFIPHFRKNGILDMVLYHHERYDGKGYPHGLKGEEIPLVARILAVADCFDAMVSKRVYRERRDVGFALTELKQNRGVQFDPSVAATLVDLVETGRLEVPAEAGKMKRSRSEGTS